MVNESTVKEILFGSVLGEGKLEMPPKGINADSGLHKLKSIKTTLFLCVILYLWYALLNTENILT
jgi:hypothetical protein